MYLLVIYDITLIFIIHSASTDTVKHGYYEFQGTSLLVRYKRYSYYIYNEF